MRKTAIIAEYNPFHNGHDYQARKARTETGADAVIAIMSGHFTQRGEPAAYDKWSRAKAAVSSGAIDLVIELPTHYAVQRADRFASGAVRIAERLRCDTLSFGSESGTLEAILSAANADVESDTRYKTHLARYLREGHSAAKASSLAFSDVWPSFDLTQPNNILAYHYAKAATSISLHTVKRVGAGFHETDAQTIMSATGIRRLVLDEQRIQAVPTSTVELFEHYPMNHWDNYWPYLRLKLRTSTPEQLAQFVGVDESLAPRLLESGLLPTFHDALEHVRTRRYTRTSIQRAYVSILLNWTKQEYAQQLEAPLPVRPLAFNEIGRQVLHDVKKEVPLTSRYHPSLAFESRAAEAYRLPIHRDDLVEFKRVPHFIRSR